MTRIFNSLKLKTILGLGLILAVVFFFVLHFNLREERRVHTDQEISALEALADTIVTAMQQPMLTGDQPTIQKQFEGYRRLKKIKQIELLDREGTVKRSAYAGAIGTREEFAAEPGVSHVLKSLGYETKKQFYQDMNIPQQSEFKSNQYVRFEGPEDSLLTFVEIIDNSPECYQCHSSTNKYLGAIKISLDWASVQNTIDRHRRASIIVFFSALFAIAFLASILLLRYVINPITKLESAATQMANGNFDQNLEISSPDEIGSLTFTFNRMAKVIKQYLQKEKEFSREQERQKNELLAANQNLQEEMLEREQAQRMRDESEEKFTKVVNNLNIGLVVITSTFEIGTCNEQFKTMFPEETAGDSSILKPYINDASGVKKKSPVTETLEDGRIHEGEFRVKIKNKFSLFRISAFPFADEKGKLNSVIMTVEDVTERFAAVRKVEEQNKFLNSVLESIPHPFYVINAYDYSVAMANSAASLGYLPEGVTCHAMTHSSSHPCEGGAHACPLEIVKRTKQPAVVEHEHHGRLVEVHGYPIFDDQGNVAQMIEYSFDITEKRLQEMELLEAKQQDELIYKVIPNGIFTTDTFKRITSWNDKAAEITGYSAAEIIGKECSLFALHPCRGHCDIFQDMARPVTAVEAKMKCKDGRIITVLKNCDLLKNIKGEVIGAIESFEDITERKSMEDDLKKERDKAQKYLDIAAVIILALNEKGEISMLNKKGCDVLGVSETEVLRKNWFDMFVPLQEREELRDVFQRTANGEIDEDEEKLIASAENRIIAKDGRVLTIFWHNAVLRDEQGRFLGILSSGEDITEKNIAAQALLESEERFKSISDSAMDAIIIMDSDSKVSYWNKSAEKIFGYKAEEIMGQNLHKVLAPEKYFSVFQNNWPRFQQSGTGNVIGRTIELEARHKDGSLFPVEISLNAVKLKDKWHAIGIVRDITERRKYEEDLKNQAIKLEEMYKMKSEFTSMVSHELRTPLTAIKESISIVLDGAAGTINEDQQEFLEMGKRNVDRLKRLIDDVLDFSKLEARKMEFRMRENDLNSLVKEVSAIHQPVAQEKGLYLNVAADDSLPKARFDYDRICQVLNNLLSNAIKFTGQGGITITTLNEKDKNSLCLKVQDTGQGIAEKDLPKLFQKFQQLGDVNRRKSGGTGLGLAISKEIISGHGGSIAVESEPGKGTTFTVCLPFKKKFLILVIDDEQMLRELCRQNLELAGYDAEICATGKEGFALAKSKKPDLILLDMKLEDINGYELIGRLRSDKDTGFIPILVMSGYKDEINKIEEGEDMVLPWILKPFKTEVLLERVKMLLEQ